jgi:hypothetical protein
MHVLLLTLAAKEIGKPCDAPKQQRLLHRLDDSLLVGDVLYVNQRYAALDWVCRLLPWRCRVRPVTSFGWGPISQPMPSPFIRVATQVISGVLSTR